MGLSYVIEDILGGFGFLGFRVLRLWLCFGLLGMFRMCFAWWEFWVWFRFGGLGFGMILLFGLVLGGFAFVSVTAGILVFDWWFLFACCDYA